MNFILPRIRTHRVIISVLALVPLTGFLASQGLAEPSSIPRTRADGIFTGVGFLPGRVASKGGICSGDGSTVVGWSNGPASYEAGYHWTRAGGMVELPELTGNPGTDTGAAKALSFNGAIVVGIGSGPNGYEAIRWAFDGAQWSAQGLGDLPGSVFSSTASAVSADGGTVAGSSRSAASGSSFEAFRWTASGGMVGLGDLPGGSFSSEAYGVSADGTIVVGFGTIKGGSRAFRWTQSGGMMNLGTLPRHKYSYANACSADGSVVVGVSVGAKSRAFRWTAASGMTDLGDGTALGVSADGSLVVGSSFVWEAASGTRSIESFLSANGVTVPNGWQLVQAQTITINGGTTTISGVGYNPSGQIEAWVAAFSGP